MNAQRENPGPLDRACKGEMNAPCTTFCPIETKAPQYIRHISEGDYQKAWDVILEDNPFGLTCGMVCHHPCEFHCRAGEAGDPIAIRALKRFAAERARDAGFKPEHSDVPDSGKKVAVVGAGPSGLTAAYFLRREGHSVTVYEASDQIGGALTHAFPAFRLSQGDVEFDLSNIKAAGMELRLHQKLGRDFTLKDLKESYDAIYLAFGAWGEWQLKIEGEDLSCIIGGLEYLRKVNSGDIDDTPSSVAVIGGGNLAIDAARTALRRGASEVHILYRRTREEMPVDSHELRAAIEEGVRLHTGWGPVSIVETSEGNEIKCRRYVGKTDDPHGLPVFDDEVTICHTSDRIIVCIGEHPESVVTSDDLPVDVEAWGGITVDPSTMATNVESVFAGGDCVTGPGALIDAIGAGKVAASSIHNFLEGGEEPRCVKPYITEVPPTRKDPVKTEEVTTERIPAVVRAPHIRNKDFDETEKIYDEPDAIREARRCLECDLEPKGNSWIRRFVQVGALFAFNGYWPGFYLSFKNRTATIYQGELKAACIPGLHCYSCPSAINACPIGSLQFWLNNAKNNFRLETLNLAGLYIIGFLGMIGAAVGRAACGWLCPFGLFQEWMYKIPAPIRLRIPKFLNYMKYAVLLIFVILMPLLLVDEYGLGLGPWFCKVICPSGTLTAGIPLIAADPGLREQIHTYFPIKMTILIIFMLWMIVSRRPFCRTTCPLGAFWAFFNRYSILRVKVHENICDDCGSCQPVCPVDIYPPTEVHGGECVRCMNCVNICQIKAMTMEIAGFETGRQVLENLGRQKISKRGIVEGSP